MASSEESDIVDSGGSCDRPSWQGVSMSEIYGGRDPFDCQQQPPICPTQSHKVLFMLPIPEDGPPKPYRAVEGDKWCQGYVRMPHSIHSLYPVDAPDSSEENKSSNKFRQRWDVIQEALLSNLLTSHQLEAAILSYNIKFAEHWDFSALHHFFNEYMDEEESSLCFNTLIPKMARLALQLPELITSGIPLLRKHANMSLSLSQLQVASLLANAFFCTFPRRNSMNSQAEYSSFPHINFNVLFATFNNEKKNRCESVMEKFKCIFHYFRRVTSKAPEGTITIKRCYVSKNDCPRWDQQHAKLPLLHITSKGTIEADGLGLLQVDFANKYVGGGVLNWGCVQEEIRFLICPELMVTMLVTEALDDTEALIVTGAERYSKYEGYSNNFKWNGDFVDDTPRDNSGRRKTSIVAIDALYFKQPGVQFTMRNIIRELNKAYVGFSSTERHSKNKTGVATGNWGCGAFHGNPQLKVLIQLMAAAVTARPMVYFTFSDTKLQNVVADMYWHLVKHNIDVGHLFLLLKRYQESPSENRSDFYNFLYNRSKMKTITDYFPRMKNSSNSSKDTMNPEKSKSLSSSISVKHFYGKSASPRRRVSDKEERKPRENGVNSLTDSDIVIKPVMPGKRKSLSLKRPTEDFYGKSESDSKESPKENVNKKVKYENSEKSQSATSSEDSSAKGEWKPGTFTPLTIERTKTVFKEKSNGLE